MTLRIPRAQAGTDFEARVEAHRQTKLAHHQTVGVPAPAEHPLVEAAVKRVSRGADPDDYVADFEVIEPTLEEKKRDLVAQIGKDQQAALEGAMTSGKRRVHIFAVSDLRVKIAADYASATEKTRADKVDPPSLDDFLKILPPSETALLAMHDRLLAHQDKIMRHAAKLHAQIEDLTSADIDLWKPEPFPALGGISDPKA